MQKCYNKTKYDDFLHKYTLVFSFIILSSSAYGSHECLNINNTHFSDVELYNIAQKCNRHGAYLNDGVFCLIGNVNFDAMNRFFDSISDIKIVVVDSGGGSSRAAIPIGKKIFEMHILTIVLDKCYSSCANYIFLASEYKVIMPKGGIFWHGSPRMAFRDLWSGRWNDKKDPLRQSDLIMHDEFVELFPPNDRKNIDSLMSNPPATMTVDSEIKRNFWHYRDEELCSKFRVPNIYRLK